MSVGVPRIVCVRVAIRQSLSEEKRLVRGLNSRRKTVYSYSLYELLKLLNTTHDSLQTMAHTSSTRTRIKIILRRKGLELAS